MTSLRDNEFMTATKLSQTNPHLAERERRARMILRSARTSSSIEGICRPFDLDRIKAAAYERGEAVEFPSLAARP
jgi:hypothetical protein